MNFSKNDSLKVLFGLVVGLAVIMYMNPPHTVCDSKKEAYLVNIQSHLKQYSKTIKLCREHTDPGGCLPFFEVMGKLLAVLDDVGTQCRLNLNDDKLSKAWITSSMELIVRAAWGTKPPANYQVRSGWLDMSQLATFCKLKKNLTEIFGQDAWLQFVDNLLNDLPEAKNLGRNEAWIRSVLSDSCKY